MLRLVCVARTGSEVGSVEVIVDAMKDATYLHLSVSKLECDRFN